MNEEYTYEILPALDEFGQQRTVVFIIKYRVRVFSGIRFRFREHVNKRHFILKKEAPVWGFNECVRLCHG